MKKKERKINLVNIFLRFHFSWQIKSAFWFVGIMFHNQLNLYWNIYVAQSDLNPHYPNEINPYWVALLLQANLYKQTCQNIYHEYFSSLERPVRRITIPVSAQSQGEYEIREIYIFSSQSENVGWLWWQCKIKMLWCKKTKRKLIFQPRYDCPSRVWYILKNACRLINVFCHVPFLVACYYLSFSLALWFYVVLLNSASCFLTFLYILAHF